MYCVGVSVCSLELVCLYSVCMYMSVYVCVCVCAFVCVCMCVCVCLCANEEDPSEFTYSHLL